MSGQVAIVASSTPARLRKTGEPDRSESAEEVRYPAWIFGIFPVAIRQALRHIGPACGESRASGCSSGVEHNLAKVGVEGSNPFARSKFSQPDM